MIFSTYWSTVRRLSRFHKMEDLDKARKKRRVHRGTTTKLLNKIENLLKEDDIDRIKLKQFLIELKEKQKTIKELDDVIFELMIENALEDDVCEKEAEEASEIKERITYGIVSIEDSLEAIRDGRGGSVILETSMRQDNSPHGSVTGQNNSPAESVKSLSRFDSQESLNSVASSANSMRNRTRKVKLPQLELKKFSGKTAEWQEFWDGYKSAVHDDNDLAKVDKFKYLRSYLEEPAKSVVTGFALTDANYDEAVDLLFKRYAKPGFIKRAHINKLLFLDPVFKETSVERLRALRDQIETHFRALEAQGVDKDSYSTVVVPAVMEKIPQSTRYNMIRFSGKDHMEWNVGDLLEALEKELEVLEGHVPIMKYPQQRGNEGKPPEQRQQQNRPKQQGPSTATALFSGKEGGKKCPFCSEEHLPENCDKVKDPLERKKVLFKNARCFNCFIPGHRVFQCRSKAPCKICKGKHHHAICSSSSQDKETQPKPSAPSLDPNANVWVGNTGSEGSVALQTALAKVDAKKEGNDVTVRVLFDTGSQKSFITAKAVGRLGLRPVRKENLGIKAFGRKEAEEGMRDVIELSLLGPQGEKKVSIEAFVVEDIATISNVHVEIVKKQYAHLKNVYFSDVSRYEDTLEIDCLVGSDFFWAFHDGEVIRGGPDEPVAVKTTIGWVLSGPVKGEILHSSSDCNVNCLTDSTSLFVNSEKHEIDSQLNKLWDLESIGIRVEDEVHTHVIDNVFFTGKRYSVGLPWKVAHKPLATNYSNSLARLKSQVRKLKETPEIFEKYNEVISQQVRDGIVEQVTELDPATKIHFLPHRAVIREDAETTKLRVVYDASCKDRKTGVSLNDCLHVGPSLTPMILDVLLRFRANQVALVGDIEKAFLNIEIHPEDRDCLRFLWLKDIHSPDPEVITLRFQRVVFGCNSSPFLLNAVLRHHINRYVEQDPEFVRKLLGGFFVDDLVTGGKDTQDTLTLYEKAKERMKSGGFSLRKWKTNDGVLAKEIEKRESKGFEEKKNDPTVNESYAKETLGVPNSSGGKGKVLGLTWDYKKDTLEFDLAKVGKDINNSTRPTKRGILSTLASLFDPQGLISPIGVTAKILFQELCVDKLDWDDPLPDDKCSRWEAWLKDLNNVKTISIPRCMFDKNKGEVLSCQLHGFADASKKAYCAMVFLVCKTKQGSYTQLLCAKSRVAPLKELSIPRLELMSARILATLMDTVLKALDSEIKIDCVRYWLDSKTALFWIANNGEWKQFVQHRVNEILLLSRKEDWGHVPGVENPADLGSRGVSASHLNDSRLWWEGPEWLKQEEEKWPPKLELDNSTEIASERKRVNVMVAAAKEPKGVSSVIDIDRFSNLGKLLRVTAYVKRFIENIKLKKEGKELKTGNMSVEELEKAERLWIIESQLNLQSSSNFKKISEHLGVVKENEILICKGRLGNSELDFRTKFPIILPKENKFTELVIIDCHHKVHHCKERATLAELRSKFWVTKGRQCVKKVIRNCFICRKLEGKAFNSPPTAMLPDFRVTEAPPFSKMGVDFAGPLYAKGPTGVMTKCYIALFTCCVTRAVHLELVENLLASTFVNCLRRVCSRRGTPTLMVSDNAKTFKATVKLLKKLAKDRTVVNFLESRRITWRFNLERAPWAGGIFERMVGTVKRCLRKVLGNARLSFDELSTVITEIECTVNSRPLTYQYNDLERPLTPSHLIFGRRFSPLSENIDLHVDTDEGSTDKLSKRFLYLTRKLQHFWNRWRREYLVDLREFHKLKQQKPVDVAKDDVVLIHEDNVKRGEWKMGVIEELITGKDGQVRGAKVRKLGRGKFEILTRPLQKLYPLEITNRDHDKKQVGHDESLTEEEEMRKEVESKENEEKIVKNGDTKKRNRPLRAAAKDARLLSKLMLDP